MRGKDNERKKYESDGGVVVSVSGGDVVGEDSTGKWETNIQKRNKARKYERGKDNERKTNKSDEMKTNKVEGTITFTRTKGGEQSSEV